ncbi:hypothetical protein VKT23_010241 [Stygiomarasmius scandens]|uniref:ABM domain-containing protein n=1 Tax=Marasmiellus scandens TaxID=2682957 RepID=A0ABR1JDA2_9AGAR
MLVNNLLLLLSSLLFLQFSTAASVARGTEDSQPCPDPPDFSNIPDKTSSGKLMVLGRVQVVEGKEARWEQIISDIKAFVETGAEPGTLTYRATRVVDENANPTGEYVNIEEYTSKEALLEHLRSPPACQFLRESSELLVSQVLEVVDEF